MPTIKYQLHQAAISFADLYPKILRGVVIHPVLDALKVTLGQFSNIRTLGNKPPEDAVSVFIASHGSQ